MTHAPDHDLTEAETSAGVTPTNYEYPPFNVKRYGATGDGVTNDAPAIQAAIDVAKERGGEVLLPEPAVTYLVTSALDCTYTGSANKPGFTIRGQNIGLDASRLITAKHTGHVFDCAGSPYIVFENIVVGTDDTTYPSTCFFLARNSDENSQVHRFNNVRVIGKFSNAILYNYGSEDNVVSGVFFHNTLVTAAATAVCIYTANNILSLSSSFITIATGAQSCIDHQIFGGQFVNSNTHNTSDIFVFDQIRSLKCFAPWVAGAGRAVVMVNTTNAASDLCQFYGLQVEAGLEPTYGFYFGDAVATVTNWTIDGCTIGSDTRAIFAHANVTLASFHVRNMFEPDSRGIEATLLTDSVIDGAGVLVLGTSRRNRLTGQSVNWTITTRDNDLWFSTDTVSWTPGTGGLTIAGGITVQNQEVIYDGQHIIVSALLTAGTSVSCAAGTTMSGLPRAATSGRYGSVEVVNINDTTTIGHGYVNGSNIVLPAINELTDSWQVRATYQAA
jgi:hypothetical protein